jgi:hypothetical protein
MKICPNCGGVYDGAVRFCSKCGSPPLQSPPAPGGASYSPLKMFVIVGIGIFGALVMLIAIPTVFGELGGEVGHLGNTIAAVSGKPARYASAPSGITMQDFLSVRTGMSLEEVTAILGSGTELSRSDIAGYSTVMYSWKNRGGSNMNVMLQNGRVVSKAQFGLR